DRAAREPRVAAADRVHGRLLPAEDRRRERRARPRRRHRVVEEPFHLGTFADEGGPFPGLVVGGLVFDLRPHLGPDATVLSLLRDWDASLERLAELASSAAGPDAGGRPIGELRVRPPVDPPGPFLCAGANYRRHVIQMMVAARAAGTPEDEAREAAERAMDERAATGVPLTFVGWPNAVVGAYDDIALPPQGEQHDWELELVVVIGRRAEAVSRDDAMD